MTFINELKKAFDKKTYFRMKLKFKNKLRDKLSNCKCKDVYVICERHEIEDAIRVLKLNYNFKIKKILINTNDIWFKPYKFGSYVVDKISSKYSKKNNLALYYGDTAASFSFVELHNIIDNLAQKKYFIYSINTEVLIHFEINENKSFLYKNYKNIIKAYNLLEDDKSKDCFIRRLSGIHYGNSFRIKNDNYPQYFHPIVKAEKNDVVISGGLGPYLDDTIMFSKVVGENGKIYAFEPEPHNVEICKNQLSRMPEVKNVEICDYGLWDCKATLKITNNTSGSSVVYDYNQDFEYSECKLISIDEFVEENNIQKVDFIKMDIEGAEPNALKGAKQTIINNKPKMALSVYHSPEHLYSLMLYLNDLNLGYKFYLGHHRTYLYETVLYCIAK
ncbi:MAG: FkbM family methyltransferase [Clostridium sp.]|nr:FkbM family methyltransferase [Clostridium sp.]